MHTRSYRRFDQGPAAYKIDVRGARRGPVERSTRGTSGHRAHRRHGQRDRRSGEGRRGGPTARETVRPRRTAVRRRPTTTVRRRCPPLRVRARAARGHRRHHRPHRRSHRGVRTRSPIPDPRGDRKPRRDSSRTRTRTSWVATSSAAHRLRANYCSGHDLAATPTGTGWAARTCVRPHPAGPGAHGMAAFTRPGSHSAALARS